MAESVYSREQVELWDRNLDEIASRPRTTFTKRQVVEELIDTIEKALTTRSYAEVASSLGEWGLEITEGSLKQYVSRYRKSSRAKAAAAGKKRAAGKKESTAGADAVNGTDGRSPVGGVKQAVDVRESRRDAVRAASKRKPKNFIDMPDEL